MNLKDIVSGEVEILLRSHVSDVSEVAKRNVTALVLKWAEDQRNVGHDHGVTKGASAAYLTAASMIEAQPCRECLRRNKFAQRIRGFAGDESDAFATYPTGGLTNDKTTAGSTETLVDTVSKEDVARTVLVAPIVDVVGLCREACMVLIAYLDLPPLRVGPGSRAVLVTAKAIADEKAVHERADHVLRRARDLGVSA